MVRGGVGRGSCEAADVCDSGATPAFPVGLSKGVGLDAEVGVGDVVERVLEGALVAGDALARVGRADSTGRGAAEGPQAATRRAVIGMAAHRSRGTIEG